MIIIDITDGERLRRFHEKLAEVMGIVQRVNKYFRGVAPDIKQRQVQIEAQGNKKLEAFATMLMQQQLTELYTELWVEAYKPTVDEQQLVETGVWQRAAASAEVHC